MTEAGAKRLHLALLVIGVAILAWSAWKPHDYFTWILEVFPAIIAGVVLTALYPRFRFTSLVYVLILIHASILMIGGHYTYAEMPLFNWLRDEFHLRATTTIAWVTSRRASSRPSSCARS